MSPNPSISAERTEHISSTASSHDEVPSESRAAQQQQQQEQQSQPPPPPYTRNAPLVNPVRDGAGSGRVISPANGLRENVPPANVPLAEGRVNDTNLPPKPRSGLARGLHIPTRVSLISWGFGFPDVLAEQGVSKEQWRLFRYELEEFARLTLSQRVSVSGYTVAITHLFSFIAGVVVAWKMTKHREHENFRLAYVQGLFKPLETRWNKNYFHPLGLHVEIKPPGVSGMEGMDLASSKLFRYQRKMGISSPAAGMASEQGDSKEMRYHFEEGRSRLKASQKGRIVVLPI